MRRISERGLALIRRFEGLRTQAYRDVAGVWTIGYGRTGPSVREGLTITPGEAEAFLRGDVRRFERAVSEAVTVPITQGQFDALVSLSYNIGAGAFGASTALARLNRGDVAGAAAAMTWWDKATVGGGEAGRKVVVRGLVRRREAEVALFLSGHEADDPSTAPDRATHEAGGEAGGGAGAPLELLHGLGLRLGDWLALRR